MHGVGGVHRGLLLDVLFELGHHNQDLVRAARRPGTHRGSPGGCMRGVLGVLCPLHRLTGRGGLWLCPRLTMAHHRDMGVPARDRAKAKAMTRAIARRHTTGIIGLLELNGFFACTAGTPYCIGAAHIACPRSKPVLDVRVQPYATWQHGHHGIVCIEASATIGAHALPLMIISTSF